MFGLDFDEIVSIDFEYIPRPGELPEVVCLVYRELGSGREEWFWVDELGPEPPFRVDAKVLFIGYFLSAEWSCFLQLGWPLPARSVDLFVEHRVDRNGIEVTNEKRGLLDACSFHGLLVMSKDEKGEMRDLVLRGGPWSPQERRAILNYCAADVVNAAALFERQMPAIEARWQGWGRAFLRGEAMKAVAHMERNGVSLDVATLERFRAHWSGIRDDLIAGVDQRYGVDAHSRAIVNWSERAIVNVDAPISRAWCQLLERHGYVIHNVIPAFTRRYGGLDNAEKRADHEVVIHAWRPGDAA